MILVNTANGSCVYAETYYDCDDNCLNDSDGDGVCDELEIAGCTDVSAFNYNSSATDNDGSCIAVALGCTDSAALNFDSSANTDNGDMLLCLLDVWMLQHLTITLMQIR